MAELEIREGETRRIVRAADAETEYQVDVLEGVVRVVHDKELAQRGEGKRLLTSDRTTFKQLDGQPLFATAVEGRGDAVIDMSGTHFTADFQERTDDATIGTLESIVNNDPDLLEGVDAIANDADEAVDVLEAIEQHQQEIVENQETTNDLLEAIEENTNGED